MSAPLNLLRSLVSKPAARRNLAGVFALAAVLGASALCTASFDRTEVANHSAVAAVARAAKPVNAAVTEGRSFAPDEQIEAMRKLYQQQQNVAAISNMMNMRHMATMSVINNIGSSNTRYEYKYVRRP